jgi:hypothetical protein
MKPRPRKFANDLRHPVSTLITGLVGFAIFAGAALASNTVEENNSASVWTTITFLFFAVMSLAMVAEYFRARHRLIPDGLAYGGLLRRRGEFMWADVLSIEYNEVMKWFKVKTRQGATVRLSASLMGLPAFAKQVQSHVPAVRIPKATRSILAETANGNPPSVW